MPTLNKFSPSGLSLPAGADQGAAAVSSLSPFVAPSLLLKKLNK